ncbi:MAG TPA: A/G-specific adenine glycosylase [Armatimonadota bacterium]|nr:A/G-specific adenine glycosylase [Armatimonadota bacterium]
MPPRSPKPRLTTDARRRAAELSTRLLGFYDREGRDLPWRQTKDPYRVWVSEVMLQQTQVVTVLPYYARFLEAFPTVRALAESATDDVLAMWAGLGYYGRARNLQAAARVVVANHGGVFPRDWADALALPGVGRYMAGAVLSIAFGQRLPAVDGNAERALARVFLVRGHIGSGRAKARIHALAEAAVPADRPGDHNQALMELGALVCTPRAPQCGRCAVRELCGAAERGLQEAIPRPRPRPAARAVTAVAAVVRRDSRVLIRRQSGPGAWSGLWVFPHAEGHELDAVGLPADLAAPTGRVVQVRHTVMQRRIDLKAHECRAAQGVALPQGEWRWVKASELEAVALPAPHRKVARLLGLGLPPTRLLDAEGVEHAG